MLQISDCCILNDVYKPGGCSCLSGIVVILTSQLLHSCLGTITTSVFRLSVQVHRVRRSTGRSDVQVHRVRRSTGRSGVQVHRVRRSTGRSGVQVHGVRRSRHVEGRNIAALFIYYILYVVMWNQTLYLLLQMMIPLLLCRQQGRRGAHKKTYGIRKRQRNVYASLEVWMF